jgi:hypothetical protein
MRKERLVRGLNNSQKIRVMVAGVGFYTTVGETENICTRRHRMATHMALMNLVNARGTNPDTTGFGFNYAYSENGGTSVEYTEIQVDLVD